MSPSEAIEEAREALRIVQQLVAEGAREGFNAKILGADYFDRLFLSNQTTSRALAALNEVAVSGLTIEPHGDGHAVYSGRDDQHHGNRLFNVTDATDAGLKVITDLIACPTPSPNKKERQ